MENQILDQGSTEQSNFNFDERIQQLQSEGFSFEIGRYISTGNKIFLKNAGPFIGYLLLCGAIMIVSSLIPLIGQVLNFVLGPALVVGFSIVARKIYHGHDFQFGNFFAGFKQVLQLFLNKLVQLIVLISLFVVYCFIVAKSESNAIIYFYREFLQDGKMTQNEAEQFLEFLEIFKTFTVKAMPIMLVMFVLQGAWILAQSIIVFAKKNFWEAMSISFKLMLRKVPMLLLFFILIALINMLGAVLLLVGLFYTIPLTFCAMYSMYEHIIGTDPADYSV